MRYGKCSSRQRPHDAVSSSRVPSVAREHPALAARYGLNPKTVAKWRKRTTTVDAPMGPKAPKRTVLTPAEEAIVVTFRQKTLLPLDDVLGCLRDPNLSRSALHRCLQRHGHADGKLIMFLAIDLVSKFTYVEFHDCAGKMEGSAFIRKVVEVFPYQATSCSPITAWPSPTSPKTAILRCADGLPSKSVAAELGVHSIPSASGGGAF